MIVGPLLLAVEQVVLVQVLDGDLVELVALLLVVREAELQYNSFTNPFWASLKIARFFP